MSRLSQSERMAVVEVLNERLAGGASDLRDALGLESVEDAEKRMKLLDSAKVKLAASLRKPRRLRTT